MGLELQRRKLNFRETWEYESETFSAGSNYYPVNGMILIEDEQGNAAVLLNDRSQGGSSLHEGQLELMIQRRLLYDDSRGVGEALNERNLDGSGVTQKVRHLLGFFNQQEQPNFHRQLQYQLDLEPIQYYSTSTNIDFPTTLLDDNLRMLAYDAGLVKTYLQPWIHDGQYLLRIQNFNEVGDVHVVKPQHVHLQ